MASEDKPFSPPPSRLRKLREQGDIARSRDLAMAGALLAGSAMLALWGGSAGLNLVQIMRAGLKVEGFARVVHEKDFFAAATQRILGAAEIPLLLLFAAALFGSAVLAGVAPGLALSAHNLAPRAEKISPLTYFKRLFSAESLFGLGKAIAVQAVVFLFARSALARAITMGRLVDFVSVYRAFILRCAVLACVVAVLDYGWNRYRYNQRVKLSRKEMLDALKEDEGDPLVRRRRLALMRRRRRRRAGNPADASVVLVNPAHFAVALRYRMGFDRAPVCVAKGAGDAAARIVLVARMAGIPVVPNPVLCRALYRSIEVGEEISTRFYRAVAEVFATLLKAEQEASGVNRE